MRFLIAPLILGACLTVGLAQQPPKDQAPPKQATAPPTSLPETQKIEAPAQSEAPRAASDAGYLEPAQLKTLLHKIWLAEYRINDLLTEVHPERWKIQEAARNSFNQTLENLRKSLGGLGEWRSQFEKRPESMYLGYQTYVAISAVLPRLDAVARSISQHENPSFGVQYSHAGNQLFDLQQALQPYLAFLLRNQDQILSATQSNLAACQNELGFAMRGRTEPATPMKNINPEFKGRSPRGGTEVVGKGKPAQKVSKPAEKKPEKKPEEKPSTAKKPTTAPAPAKPRQTK